MTQLLCDRLSGTFLCDVTTIFKLHSFIKRLEINFTTSISLLSSLSTVGNFNDINDSCGVRGVALLLFCF